MKMWNGRFKSDIDTDADSFNSSLPFDKRLYIHDITGSIAHCTMLGKCGIIPKSESDNICKALSEILDDIQTGKLKIKDAEDIHMFIEAELTRRIGDVGKKLHTARSRNDQVALDIRLYLRDSVDKINKLIKALIEQIITIASENLGTLIPTYTHMQKAQPGTLAHYYLAYAEMFMRDFERFIECRKRINVMPLGAGALTGTTYPIDRAFVAKLLNFDTITQNSMDSVSDRDFALEYLFNASILLMHLSRFNEEIIYWSTDEFGYITLDDKFSTGSSIMPQKKNPDICELIRGKTGRVYGNLMSLLTIMKGLPLAYNKDMQEDKEPLFDTEDTIIEVLRLFTAMLPTMQFNKERLRYSANGGFSTATDCADYLVKKGMPFREAHSIIGKLVLYCSENNKSLDSLSLAEFKSYCSLFEDDIKEAVKIENAVNSRIIDGAPSPCAVKKEIKLLKEKLSKC